MIDAYINRIAARYKTGIAREHSYRGDLQSLVEVLNPGVLVTNEPARIACGAPDYILTRKNIPIGYIEAKDIGASLHKIDASEQMARYKASLDNLILTDYCEFWFYRNGEKVHSVAIAELKNGKIISIPADHERFTHLLQDFCLHIGQTIASAQKLAEMMAGKAKLMQMAIETALKSDDRNEQNSSLQEQMAAFKKILIHDITPEEFADIYAQTLAYGMFAARLHDPILDTFTRQEAAALIPKTNPFLRKLFSYIAGIDIDTRIVWIVDALADIFRAADVASILQNFGQGTQTRDPMIHFYETFLAAYNPKLRKSRGVWYTPEPVVRFIVRAVDDILKTEFGLAQGLADTSKTTIEVDTQIEDRRSKTGYKREKLDVHKVQILDPAAGTGTFLAEVVRQIHRKFQGQQGIWSQYVEKHLLPRLHGFEILMASYAMAHLKLELLLQETGYAPETPQRLRVFLTNSLEEAHPDTGTLWATWLSREATEANYIKRDTPVMVVLGNPPYSVSSSNASIGADGQKTWIGKLIDEYKKDLNEKKLNLDDDYIKFIRYGEYFIEKNGEGILAYISNNSFLDGITHRQMRKHLLETFDTIYILDLHGNAKRKETAPDGGKDENVFGIMQGVSINIFIKKKGDNRLGQVCHYDLFGKREYKYKVLTHQNIKNLQFNKIEACGPHFFFVPKDNNRLNEYEKYFSLTDLFIVYGNGIGTDRDKLFYDFDKTTLKKRISMFYSEVGLSLPFRDEYKVRNSSGYPLLERRNRTSYSEEHIQKCLYRPFDRRWLYYNSELTSRPAKEVMIHLSDKNFGLCVTRQITTGAFRHVFIANCITDRDPLSLATRERTQIFPLYLFRELGQKSIDDYLNNNSAFSINFKESVLKEIVACIHCKFVPEQRDKDSNSSFTSVDVFDYIYAVLHSPTYRETYKEFLKIDFPRIPYPNNQDAFWELAGLGGELRQLHLLESPKVNQFITTYPQNGDNKVTRKITQKDYERQAGEPTGRVWINEQQYFDHVPQIAWELYIGGYQPAQKWLKDRQGRTLEFDDILHYQKIIVALTETDRIMQAIDMVDFLD